MLRKKLDDLVKSTEDLTIYIEEDFFLACLFSICESKGSHIRYNGRNFRIS